MLGNTSSCAFQVWFGSCVLGLRRLVVLCRCLKKFFWTPQLRLIKLGHHDVTLRLWCFGHGRTDWDSQYLSWEEVYCATSPRRIFLTFRQDSLYSRCRPLPICGTTFSELWHFTLWASSLLPSTYFQPNLLPSEPSHSWVTSSAHPHRLSSIKLAHQKGWPDPAVPFISERSCGM